MGFNARVTFAYDIGTDFLRKIQKTKKCLKLKNIFQIFSMKEASKINNRMIFGIVVKFVIEWCTQKLILTK